MSNSNCGFDGNSDIYGLGIRIGYYTQALAVWFSNFFFLGEAQDLRTVNSLFLLALTIIILVYAHNAGQTYAIEVFLLMQIGFCLGSVSIMDSTRYSSKYLAASKEQLILKTILLNAGLVYNLYFWWYGLDAYQATPCGTFAFYFVRASIYERLRTVMKVFAVAGLIWRTLFTTIYDAGKVLRRYRFKEARRRFIQYTHDEIHLHALPEKFQTLGSQSKALPASASMPLTKLKTSEDSIQLCPPISLENGKEQQTKTTQKPALSNPMDDRKASVGLAKANALSSRNPVLKPNRLTELKRTGELGFPQIYQAEKFLSQIINSFPQNTRLSAKERLASSCSCFVQRQKVVNASKLTSGVSVYTQLLNAIKITRANKNIRYIRDTLSVHNKATDLQIYQWPIIINRLLSSTVESSPPDWQAVAIASDIQLSQLPLIIPKKIWLFNLIQSLSIIAILVVQIEVTIVWNHIHSIQTLNSVGQLFPFILGVGGLAKVLWGKWKRLRKGVREDEEIKGRRLSEYEIAMERYLEWKKQQEDQSTGEKSGNIKASAASASALV